MSFFSSWMKAIFVIALLFPLYSETSFLPSANLQRTSPDCNLYKDRIPFCTREWNPICATNGQTYPNPCVFCSQKLDFSGKFDFSHYGEC